MVTTAQRQCQRDDVSAEKTVTKTQSVGSLVWPDSYYTAYILAIAHARSLVSMDQFIYAVSAFFHLRKLGAR
jgi:hypothetical protein